ncbi:MAG: hypothetical protein Q9201_005623 [Fulgogasparrea decipioides]
MAAIANSVGIAPLELFMNWQLRRINREMAEAGVPGQLFLIIYALVIVAVILAIVGAALASYSPRTPFHAETEQKVAIIMLIVTFGAMLVVNISMLATVRHHIARTERVTFIALTLANPFVTSRLTYACISAFYVSETFSPVAGNVYVLAFMSVFEEFTAAVLYFIACLWTPRLKTKSAEKPANTEELSGVDARSKSLDDTLSHKADAEASTSEAFVVDSNVADADQPAPKKDRGHEADVEEQVTSKEDSSSLKEKLGLKKSSTPSQIAEDIEHNPIAGESDRSVEQYARNQVEPKESNQHPDM